MSMATALIVAMLLFFYVLLVRWHFEHERELDRDRKAVASLRGDLGNLVRRLDSLDRTAGQAASHDAALWREIDKASAAREGLAERITTVQTDAGCLRKTVGNLGDRIDTVQTDTGCLRNTVADLLNGYASELEDFKLALGKALGFEPVREPQ